MYTFTLTDHFLSKEEQLIFKDHLAILNLEDNIWEVFAALFRSGTSHTKPLILRAFDDSDLIGAAIIIKCYKYGAALHSNKIISGIINASRVPFYLWIRFGCGMDMMSNPGFAKHPGQHEEVCRAMVDFMGKNFFLTIINDYSSNQKTFPSAAKLPALPHAWIDCTKLDSIEDYLKDFKNIKKKIKVFHKKGGDYSRVEKKLSAEEISSLRKCFLATAENSVFYLPYQDLYLVSAMETSQTSIDQVHYFIATLNGEFLGYQAAIQSGKHLNALHGAFDRERKTTYHAYDILFVKMTEYALEQRLESIDFGAVLNYTKQKMVNQTREMSYFILSKHTIVQNLMQKLLRSTRIQGRAQLKFREGDHEPEN